MGLAAAAEHNAGSVGPAYARTEVLGERKVFCGKNLGVWGVVVGKALNRGGSGPEVRRALGEVRGGGELAFFVVWDC